MLNTSTKFLWIMEMASVEIGGYELRFDTGSVFYTENFFSILGIPLSAELPMNIEKFREILKEYTEKNLYKTKSGSTKLYCIRIPEKVFVMCEWKSKMRTGYRSVSWKM